MCAELVSMGILGTTGEDGSAKNFGPGRRWRREPLEGPGSEVDTIPMSSMSFPYRTVGGGLEGAALSGDLRLRGRGRFGARQAVSILSSRGRFAGLDGYPWDESGLETCGEVGEGHMVVSSARHVWRGAVTEGPTVATDWLSGIAWGAAVSTGDEAGHSSESALRLRWLKGTSWARSSIR